MICESSGATLGKFEYSGLRHVMRAGVWAAFRVTCASPFQNGLLLEGVDLFIVYIVQLAPGDIEWDCDPVALNDLQNVTRLGKAFSFFRIQISHGLIAAIPHSLIAWCLNTCQTPIHERFHHELRPLLWRRPKAASLCGWVWLVFKHQAQSIKLLGYWATKP